jgi:hypothetical protein
LTRDSGRRIERIEKLLGAADCICNDVDRFAVMIFTDDWSDDRKKAAAKAQVIVCPAHGAVPQKISWINTIDADL